MQKQNHILVVDDNEMNRAMLVDMLSSEYKVTEAANGREAIDILRRQELEISLVLLDIVMPEMDGFEVLAMMNKLDLISRIPVITISAENSSAYIDHAYDLGATDYISRPFDVKTVHRRVRNTLMLYTKQHMLENMVADQIVEKEKNNFLMVEILSNIVEFRNGESGLHVLHIRVLTEIFLRKLQEITDQYPLSTAQMAMIVNASALHDVGKISIPEEILNKPGKLTAEEFEIMKTHSALGAQIMEDARERHQDEFLRYAYNICRWHHERYDGKGYPDGLAGDDIPIEAQVIALADVYDALTSVRVYKEAYSGETALQMIFAGECGAFHPLLLRCLRETAPYLEEKLRLRSLRAVSEENIQQLSSGIIANGEASGRTLMLLERERTKYQFFASMSNEIQFEYSYKTDILTMSEWGARQLGLPVLIEHPEQSEVLRKVFSADDYLELRDSLRHTAPDHPIVSANYRLCIAGMERWYKATARPVWEGGDTGRPTDIIGKFVDNHEEQLRLDNLQQQAEQDSLTGLCNHATAKKQIQELLSEPEKKYALLLLDIDHFKEANDRRGHLFGDHVLQCVAERIQKNVRLKDIAARVGGDEFMLFLEYKDHVETMVSRIFNEIHGNYKNFDLTISMGVSLSSGVGVGYESLFHTADQALYVAKKEGRDRFIFYNETMKDQLSVLSPMDH